MKTLKEVRESLGKSREQIAVECHVTAATVRNWETAATEPNGRAKDFVLMCGAYGLTLEGLVEAINATHL